MLSDIQLSCPLEECDEIVSYDFFKNHQENCSYNIAKCEFCDENVPKQVMNSHKNDCNNFIRQKMAELVVENEAVKTELTKTKLELDDANLKLKEAKLELREANLENQRLKQELRRKLKSTSSSETISQNQETDLNSYEVVYKYMKKRYTVLSIKLSVVSACMRNY